VKEVVVSANINGLGETGTKTASTVFQGFSSAGPSYLQPVCNRRADGLQFDFAPPVEFRPLRTALRSTVRTEFGTLTMTARPGRFAASCARTAIGPSEPPTTTYKSLQTRSRIWRSSVNWSKAPPYAFQLPRASISQLVCVARTVFTTTDMRMWLRN